VIELVWLGFSTVTSLPNEVVFAAFGSTITVPAAAVVWACTRPTAMNAAIPTISRSQLVEFIRCFLSNYETMLERRLRIEAKKSA